MCIRDRHGELFVNPQDGGLLPAEGKTDPRDHLRREDNHGVPQEPAEQGQLPAILIDRVHPVQVQRHVAGRPDLFGLETVFATGVRGR